ITGQYESDTQNFGLSVLASLSIERKTWLANEEFKIVFNSTDFRHKAKEVELERTI
ncbi:hypothetical protein K431DRAFT_236662, partial [Polychaeton citri CBS 116435]